MAGASVDQGESNNRASPTSLEGAEFREEALEDGGVEPEGAAIREEAAGEEERGSDDLEEGDDCSVWGESSDEDNSPLRGTVDNFTLRMVVNRESLKKNDDSWEFLALHVATWLTMAGDAIDTSRSPTLSAKFNYALVKLAVKGEQRPPSVKIFAKKCFKLGWQIARDEVPMPAKFANASRRWLDVFILASDTLLKSCRAVESTFAKREKPLACCGVAAHEPHLDFCDRFYVKGLEEIAKFNGKNGPRRGKHVDAKFRAGAVVYASGIAREEAAARAAAAAQRAEDDKARHVARANRRSRVVDEAEANRRAKASKEEASKEEASKEEASKEEASKEEATVRPVTRPVKVKTRSSFPHSMCPPPRAPGSAPKEKNVVQDECCTCKKPGRSFARRLHAKERKEAEASQRFCEKLFDANFLGANSMQAAEDPPQEVVAVPSSPSVATKRQTCAQLHKELNTSLYVSSGASSCVRIP